MTKKYDVIVIGGGASGMMAAGCAAELGAKVLLLEKNKKLGEKLKITGGGRCNITNAEFDQRKLLAHYGRAEQFLYSAFSQFGVKDTFNFFEGKGLPLVVETNQRAFPQSQKALDVLQILENYLKKGKVEIKSGAEVKRIVGEKGTIKSVVVGSEEYESKSYILATGGKSHPETGSTGDGFAWLRTLGHKVEEPTPTLVPLKVKEIWVKKLAGTSLDKIKITFFTDSKKKLMLKGRILFTHLGLSGPLILNAAGKVADLMQEGSVTALIDLYPDDDLQVLDKKVTATFDANKNKALKNILKEIMPTGLDKIISDLLPAIDLTTKVHSVSKEERKLIVAKLKAIPLTIAGLMGFDKAVVADGGLSLGQVDTKTMRSKLYSNLYVTGDLLHISRPSGGYSLQLCWTTGFVAGTHAANYN